MPFEVVPLLRPKPVSRFPVVVNYGGGTNSTALLIEAVNRGLHIDRIVFADTGSERPETYEYLDAMDRYLFAHGLPLIERVRWIRQDGSFVSLHDWCFQHNQLPSKAFGYSGCTSKWKQQPIDKHLAWAFDATFKAGLVVERWIGYDADEPHRAERMLAKNPHPERWRWRAPLIEWGMGRDECIAVIDAAGVGRPGKSSCWMCPSMKKPEIIQLGRKHPELANEAVRMEQNWATHNKPEHSTHKGLGRNFAWADVLAGQACGIEVVEEDCGCYDGDA